MTRRNMARPYTMRGETASAQAQGRQVRKRRGLGGACPVRGQKAV